MTERTDDGWPDKYRDPRDRSHPSVLRITVESFAEMQEDSLDTAEAVGDGDKQPAVVSFRTVEELRKILTDRRIELLRALMATEGAAESISALAATLDRDYRTVHEDVSLLTEYGLVFLISEGQAKRPYLPYERIHIDVELVGGMPGEEPTLA